METLTTPYPTASMIRLGRQSRAMTPRELARKIGIKTAELTAYESNVRFLSDEKIIAKLCVALNYPRAFFCQVVLEQEKQVVFGCNTDGCNVFHLKLKLIIPNS